MVKEIECFGGRIALCDDEDYLLLSRFKWQFPGCAAESRRYPSCYIYGKGDTHKYIPMHQMVSGGAAGIDHKDRDVMNNQKDNLRIATSQQNAWNSKKRTITCTGKPPSSQYKGVSKYNNTKGESLWRVCFILTKKGERPIKHFTKSGFKSEKEAALFYNQEVVKFRGEWAVLNIVTEDLRATA